MLCLLLRFVVTVAQGLRRITACCREVWAKACFHAVPYPLYCGLFSGASGSTAFCVACMVCLLLFCTGCMDVDGCRDRLDAAHLQSRLNAYAFVGTSLAIRRRLYAYASVGTS